MSNTSESSSFSHLKIEEIQKKFNLSEYPNVFLDRKINLNKTDYKIIRQLFKDESVPEGFYFEIQDPDDKKYILKLYFKYNSHDEEPKPSVLNVLKETEHPNLLKLADFGSGIKKYQYRYCFEIYEYEELMPLSLVPGITIDFIIDEILYNTFFCLDTLRTQDILFLQIRPSDIFLGQSEGKRVVKIAPYYSAILKSKFPVINPVSRNTSGLTDFYLPPEVINGKYFEKSELYSLGLSMLTSLDQTLFNEEFMELLRASEKLDFGDVLSGVSNKKIASFLNGVINHKVEERWGFEECRQWLSGEKYITQGSKKKEVFTLRVLDKELNTINDLHNFISSVSNWSFYLIDNVQNYEVLLAWLTEQFNDDFRQEFVYYLNDMSTFGKPYLGSAVKRFLKPDFPIQLLDQVFDITDTDKINKTISDYFRLLEKNITNLSLQDIRFSIFELCYTFSSIISKLKGTQKSALYDVYTEIYNALSLKENEFGYVSTPYFKELNYENFVTLFYIFIKDRGFPVSSELQHHDIRDVAFFFAYNPHKYDDAYHKQELHKFLGKKNKDSLIGLPVNEFLLEVFKKETDVRVKIRDIKSLPLNKYEIEFHTYISLNTFFRANNVELSVDTGREKVHKISFRKFFAGKAGFIKKKFYNYVLKSTSLDAEKLNKNDLEQIREVMAGTLRESIEIKRLIAPFIIFSAVTFGIIFYLTRYQFNLFTDWLLAPDFILIYYNIMPALVLGALFSQIFVWIKKIRGVSLTLLIIFLTLLISGGYRAYSLYTYDKEVKKVREDIFVKYFIIPRTVEPIISLEPDFLVTSMDNDLKFLEEFSRPMIKYGKRNNVFTLKSETPLISIRRFKNTNGLDAAEIKKADNVRTDNTNMQDFIISSPFAGTEQYFYQSYYKFNFSAKNITFTPNASGTPDYIGISFNRYAIMFNNEHLKVIKRKDSAGQQYYGAVKSDNPQIDYTGEVESAGFDIKPAANAQTLYPGEIVYTTDMPKSDRIYSISVNVLRFKIFIYVNDVLVLNRPLPQNFWDIKENFPTAIALSYLPSTDVSVESVTLSALEQPELHGGKDFKSIPVFGTVKPGNPLFTSPRNDAKTDKMPAATEAYEILTKEKDFYKVREQLTGKIWYLPETAINTYIWKGFN